MVDTTPGLIAFPVEKILVMEDHEPIANVVAKRLREEFPNVEVFIAYDIATAHMTMKVHPDMTLVLVDAQMPLAMGQKPGVEHTCTFVELHKASHPLTAFAVWSLELNKFLYPVYCQYEIPFKESKDIPTLLRRVGEILSLRRRPTGFGGMFAPPIPPTVN